MIVDILGFAWERTSRRIPTCVVLITSDGDYSYTVAKLRDIGVCTVIVYGERTTTADVLLDACDHAMSWIFDVLQRPTVEETEGENVADDVNHVVVDTGNIESTISQDNNENTQNGRELMMPPLSRETSQSEALEGRHLVFLNCVASIQLMQLSAKHVNSTSEYVEMNWENCWALDAQVVQLFNSKRGVLGSDHKSYYKEVRKSAAIGQFIRIGRQDPNTGIIHDVTSGLAESGIDISVLRPQQYLQLTREGRAQLTGYVGGDNVANTSTV
jgi:hypothetical protein